MLAFHSVFGKGQGAASGAGSLKSIAAANSEQKFVHFGENRCLTKSNLTLPEGHTTSLWAQGGHIPGYDGFIPGLDADFGKTFGTSTVAAMLEQSKHQAAFGDKTFQSIPQSEIHSSRGGATGDLGGRAKLPAPSPPAAPVPAVPGYRGYISGKQCVDISCVPLPRCRLLSQLTMLTSQLSMAVLLLHRRLQAPLWSQLRFHAGRLRKSEGSREQGRAAERDGPTTRATCRYHHITPPGSHSGLQWLFTWPGFWHRQQIRITNAEGHAHRS